MPKKPTKTDLPYDDEGSMRVYSKAESARAAARVPDHLRPALERSRRNLLKIQKARRAAESDGRKS